MHFTKMMQFSAIVASVLLLSGCAKQDKEELTILVKMMPAQQRYFVDQIIPEFEKFNNVKINVATFNSAAEISRKLELDSKKAQPEISLVKTPFEMTETLVEKGLIQPLAKVTSKDQVSMDIAAFHPLAASMGMVNDLFYYFPRKLETRVLFYLKSKVADALAKYDGYKIEIDEHLKAENGYGLPIDYVLEEDPDNWNFYDLYVVGYIWSHEEYNGKTVGRIAHRGAKYEGTSLFLVDRAYQFGDTPENILKMDGNGVENTYLWEKAMVQDGLYATGMWQDPWKGADIWTNVQSGNVFLAYFQQIDFFNVHGWEGDVSMPSYLQDPSDMGIAIIPQAVSFEIEEDGTPVSVGSRNITTGGWWWGIPEAAPKSELAYKFAKFLTSKEVHMKEVAQFGMIPVRKDLLNNFSSVFSEGWVGEIFEKSIKQISMQLLDTNLITVPRTKNYTATSENYIDAWYTLVESTDTMSLNVESIKNFLGTGFTEKAVSVIPVTEETAPVAETSAE